MKQLYIGIVIGLLSLSLAGCDQREGKGSDMQFQQEHPGYGPGTGPVTEEDRRIWQEREDWESELDE